MFRKRVVIIDDSPEICEFLKLLLSEHGYEVKIYTDPKKGLAKLKEDFPGVLLVDYLLPGTDGIKIIKRAKKLIPQTKIIMLTGKGSEMIAVSAMKSGADDYIKKPFNDEELVNMIKGYMDEFCNTFVYFNKIYDYPIHILDVGRYEFLRSIFSGNIKNIKVACCIFRFNRQDFYVLCRRFIKYGPAGLLHQKIFYKIQDRVLPKPGPYDTVDVFLKKGMKAFIDPNDRIQRRLEMLRKAATDKKPNITEICKENNLTREAFYQIYRRFNKEGILSLIGRKKGRPKKENEREEREEERED